MSGRAICVIPAEFSEYAGQIPAEFSECWPQDC